MNDYTEIQPGYRVKVVSRDRSGPTIEGYVAVSTYTYVTIRGCGFTQFQHHDYDVTRLDESDHLAPPVKREDKALNTLVALLDDPDSSIRLAAARAVLDESHIF